MLLPHLLSFYLPLSLFLSTLWAFFGFSVSGLHCWSDHIPKTSVGLHWVHLSSGSPLLHFCAFAQWSWTGNFEVGVLHSAGFFLKTNSGDPECNLRVYWVLSGPSQFFRRFESRMSPSSEHGCYCSLRCQWVHNRTWCSLQRAAVMHFLWSLTDIVFKGRY